MQAVVRGACAEAVSYRTHPGCLCAVRQLTKIGRGLRERRRVPELALSEDGRITVYLLKTYILKEYLPDPGVHYTNSRPGGPRLNSVGQLELPKAARLFEVRYSLILILRGVCPGR